MHGDFGHGRHAGIAVPLFALPSRESWGIGEIADLPALGRWMTAAGFSFVQLLPLNEMAEGQNSPYSALSAMAIDPIFVAPRAVPDLVALGGDAALRPDERDAIDDARRAPQIEYATIRPVKMRLFRVAFDHFLRTEWEPRTDRAARLEAFIDRERWWLDSYALFRAIHAREQGRYWREWDAGVRDRVPDALEQARKQLATEILFFTYLQWLAAEQWEDACRVGGVGVFGDFPFMVSGDSADVWSRQEDFRIDASVGAPPDAFSKTGQDWGFPAYRWDAIARGGDQWLAARARRSAELYDGYRVDHLVGFYRTYVRERDGAAAFVPPDEPSQTAQGERLLALFNRSGARVIAEDLGVIPDFVRASLARMGVPGMKVLRWEREWKRPGQPFRDPRTYPPVSVATSGTHDTETLAEWWDSAPLEERTAACAIAAFKEARCEPSASFSESTRDAILRVLIGSASDLVLLPIQDVFGWRDRINRPAVISAENWTWRLPWPVEDLMTQPSAREQAAFTRAQAQRFARIV